MLKHRIARVTAGAAWHLANLTAVGALALVGLAAAITHDTAASSAERGVVYTANEQGRSVSAIDLATGRTTTVQVQIARPTTLKT